MAGSPRGSCVSRAVMLIVYAGVLAFGFNEFRKTPVGFIPQTDQGYLIAVMQLPGGAALDRTDAVNRRAVRARAAGAGRGACGEPRRLFRRDLHQRVRIPAPSSSVLAPFAERVKDPAQVRAGDPARADAEALDDRGSDHAGDRAAAGARRRHCRRLPHDDRGPRRARAGGTAGGRLRHDGARRAGHRACARYSRCSRQRRRRSISTSTASRRSGSASTWPMCSPRCRPTSARSMSTTSTCSAAPSG